MKMNAHIATVHNLLNGHPTLLENIKYKKLPCAELLSYQLPFLHPCRLGHYQPQKKLQTETLSFFWLRFGGSEVCQEIEVYFKFWIIINWNIKSTNQLLWQICRCSRVSITAHYHTTWWRNKMDTFSALLALCAGNSPVTGEFPARRPVTRSFDVFFDLGLNKRLSKQ